MTKCMCAALTGRMVICCDALSSKIDGEEQVKMQVHLSQEGGEVWFWQQCHDDIP